MPVITSNVINISNFVDRKKLIIALLSIVHPDIDTRDVATTRFLEKKSAIENAAGAISNSVATSSASTLASTTTTSTAASHVPWPPSIL